MFFRVKQAGRYRYLQVAESYRDHGRVCQRVLVTLGNLDQLRAEGKVDALLASGAKFCDKVAVLDARKSGKLKPARLIRTGPERSATAHP